MSSEDNKEKSVIGEKEIEKKEIGKGEKILFVVVGVVVLCLILAGLAINYFMPAGSAVITVDNKEYEIVSLDENKKITVENEYGKNVIIIKDGQVFMEGADCPDKTCVKQGKIMKTGQSIVCLPHRLTITISE